MSNANTARNGKSVVPTEMVIDWFISLGIRSNMRISVYDGESTVLSMSTDVAAIKAAMFSTDSETLTFWDNEGFGSATVKQGYLSLIHDSANMGLDCVATAYGPPIERFYDQIEKVIERLDGVYDFIQHVQ